MGGFRKGGFSNSRFVLKPDVAIASEVLIFSKNSLAITDFHAKKTQHVQLFENPLPGTPPFAIPNGRGPEGPEGDRQHTEPQSTQRTKPETDVQRPEDRQGTMTDRLGRQTMLDLSEWRRGSERQRDGHCCWQGMEKHATNRTQT